MACKNTREEVLSSQTEKRESLAENTISLDQWAAQSQEHRGYANKSAIASKSNELVFQVLKEGVI